MISPQSTKRLQKALYIVINDLPDKLYLSVFITATPLLVFEIALSICCLKLSFSSSIRSRSFREDALST